MASKVATSAATSLPFICFVLVLAVSHYAPQPDLLPTLIQFILPTTRTDSFIRHFKTKSDVAVQRYVTDSSSLENSSLDPFSFLSFSSFWEGEGEGGVSVSSHSVQTPTRRKTT